MKVEITQCLSGPGVLHNVGDKVKFSDKEAIRLIEAGFAVPVNKKQKKERAIANRVTEKRNG